MCRRQPDVQGHQARLGAGAEHRQQEHQGLRVVRRAAGANARKVVGAAWARQQAEAQQEGRRAQARHDQVEIGALARLRVLVLTQDQRPGGERHELPAQEKGERVVGEQDQVHAGEEGRHERQDPPRRALALAVAERIKADEHRTEIDHQHEEGGQGIQPQVHSEPGQTQGQHQHIWRAGIEECGKAQQEQRGGHGEATTIDDGGRARPIIGDKADQRQRQQRQDQAASDC